MATWRTPATPTTRPPTSCRTARQPSTTSSTRWRRALAFVRRTGNEQTGQVLDGHRWLAGVLRGESSAAAGDAVPADRYADNPLALFQAHLNRAIAAAVFGDPPGLARAHRGGDAATAGRPGHLPDRRGPPAARAGPRRAGPRRPRCRARRSAVRTGRGDAVAGRPRCGRAGQLPAPAAVAGSRAGLGGGRLSGPPSWPSTPPAARSPAARGPGTGP